MARLTNSAEQSKSRYVQGGRVDRFQNRLGWWERFPLPRSSDDITFPITRQFDRRPDLVAFQVYGQVSLMWLVLQYNSIVDINTEFIAGKSIILPTFERTQTQILTKSVGGNPVQETDLRAERRRNV